MPPPDVQIGERIKFEGFDGQPDAQLNPRKKIFEKLAPDLLTNAGAARPHICHACNPWFVASMLLSVSMLRRSNHTSCVPLQMEWLCTRVFHL